MWASFPGDLLQRGMALTFRSLADAVDIVVIDNTKPYTPPYKAKVDPSQCIQLHNNEYYYIDELIDTGEQ